jgi:hypothetical protein
VPSLSALEYFSLVTHDPTRLSVGIADIHFDQTYVTLAVGGREISLMKQCGVEKPLQR